VASALALAVLGGAFLLRNGGAVTHVRFVVPAHNPQVDPEYHWAPTLAVSPSGLGIIYRDGDLLQLRSVDDFTPRALTGTDGASMPAFSPDGRWIAFQQRGHLRKLALAGGAVMEIAQADVGLGLTWGEDERIYFSSLGGNGGIWRVPATGGVPEVVTEVADSAAEIAHAWPQLLPGGKRLLYTVLGPSGGALDSRIVTEVIGSGVRTKLVDQATFGRYLPDGQLLSVSNEGSASVVAFKLSTATVSGAAQQVLADVHVASWSGGALLAVAGNGTLVYEPGTAGAPQVMRTVDRTGRELSGILPTGYVDEARLSPDGRQIAANVRAPSKNDIWLFGSQGEPERLTFDEAEDEYPVWSPDGKSIAYTSALASQARRIQVRSVAAGTRPRRVLTWPRHLHLSSWSRDGKWLLGYDFSPGLGQNVWAIASDGSDSIPVAASAASESEPAFSPDSRWVAYQSDESGRSEIFVVSFPDLAVKRQISMNGGRTPRWDARGSTLYFLEGDRLTSVAISPQSGLRVGPGTVLFETKARQFDVSPDGARFILLIPNPGLSSPGVHVVTEWLQEIQASSRRRPN
jgi:serine/threonine-protein kinase